MNRGDVSFKDFAAVLMGPYRVMITHYDLREIIKPYLVDGEMPVPDLPNFRTPYDEYHFNPDH